jgi:hypothetical protein
MEKWLTEGTPPWGMPLAAGLRPAWRTARRPPPRQSPISYLLLWSTFTPFLWSTFTPPLTTWLTQPHDPNGDAGHYARTRAICVAKDSGPVNWQAEASSFHQLAGTLKSGFERSIEQKSSKIVR